MCSIASVVFALVYISSKSIDLFGESVNAAAKVSYIETIIPSMFSVEYGLIFCKCRFYERITGRV